MEKKKTSTIIKIYYYSITNELGEEMEEEGKSPAEQGLEAAADTAEREAAHRSLLTNCKQRKRDERM